MINIHLENALILITCENESADRDCMNRRVIFAKPNPKKLVIRFCDPVK